MNYKLIHYVSQIFLIVWMSQFFVL